MSQHVRIGEAHKETIRRIAEREGKTMQLVTEEAIEAHERRVFFNHLCDSFARLKRDPDAWSEADREREDWEGTLADGLDIE